MSSPRPDLLRELRRRVVIADGAMGTMLQSYDLTLDDFEGLEGCNEILNVTRPDVVREVHAAWLEVGVDCVETNTFGANYANLAEYDIPERIGELAEAGARLARDVVDDYSTPDHPRWVLGSVGPGTKLPSLRHLPFGDLRSSYEQQVAGLVAGGVDAVLVETCQDLLQAKAAIHGARAAMAAAGTSVPLIVEVTVETTGTMLLGSEIGAALTALEPLGIDMLGMNCATGPAEMGEHLRYLSQHSRLPLVCMPNAGLPVLTAGGAHYPLTPAELADAHDRFTSEHGVAMVGGCCGTTPAHLAEVVERVRGRELGERSPRHLAGAASLYQHVPFRQDVSYLSVGERTNANGSKGFRDAMLAEDWGACEEIARSQIRDGAHLLDLCVDYVGRDGVADMREVASRLATASTLPLMLDSTEPEVVAAGLECMGGRAVVNSVNYEDGDGPESRIARMMPLVVAHGAGVVALTIDEAGQARTTEWKLAVAERLIADLTGTWGMEVSDILVDCLTFPIATGQEETRGDAVATLDAIRELKHRHPDVQTVLGVSNVSFGLNPAARQVLNSVFLHEAVEAGLDAAIVNAARILPMAAIPTEQREVALDLVYDRRRPDYDPLSRLLELFDGVDAASMRAERAHALLALPLFERLERRIVDGEREGLEADLDAAMKERDPLSIVNDTLLVGMKTVGELFGAGEMQLPFVLQSAEVMKAAVAHLEPYMERSDTSGKATIVLATVKGDVHDIGKNLVDIILSNNGFDVVNIGIKQPVNAIIRAAEEHDADAIGMSGLLVKSTVVMRDNLAELQSRGYAERWPILLGGAALTRAYVEQDLADAFAGEVRYAKDAFEGLTLMEAVAKGKADPAGVAAHLPERRQRRVSKKPAPSDSATAAISTERSDVATDNVVPEPPFWGSRVVKGVALAEYARYLDERALFVGQWGLRPGRSGDREDHERLVETEGRKRLRAWMDRLLTDNLLDAGVVYGYWPAVSEGNDLVVLDPDDAANEVARFTFPRQTRDRRLCLADFFRSRESGQMDVLPLQLVTVGDRIAERTATMFAEDQYRDYLELHGLSVQLAEALAEYWHARVRADLGFAAEDDTEMSAIFRQGYRGSRYSFGYPACPDLEDRRTIVNLLRPERIGVTLSEELQLHPEQSTDALVVHHPEAKYFRAT